MGYSMHERPGGWQVKITGLELKQIIEEVIKEAEPRFLARTAKEMPVRSLKKGRTATSQAKKQSYDASRQMGSSGITDQERHLINTLQQKMQKASQQGNLGSGRALRLITLLVAELDKIGQDS